jgi:three-Cys-motif partner protein
MTEKPYAWKAGAQLSEHSRRKHKVVREYIADYLGVRCGLPVQSKFRLAFVEGFAGGGRYVCGSPGSPLIFLEELLEATERLNVARAAQGMSPIDFECLLVCNDYDPEAIRLLKSEVAPVEAAASISTSRLKLQIEYLNEKFEAAYPKMKAMVSAGRYRNVIFNLDQCGHSHVSSTLLTDIMQSFRSAEVFYTFAIDALVAFLPKSDLAKLQAQLAPFGVSEKQLLELHSAFVSDKAWLGAAERTVFDTFKECARFVSPFSINNPDGWRYWLIHLANSYRARQVYNNVLHTNSSLQAHFGRSGLNMLAYDPRHEGAGLYLFDAMGRDHSRRQLADDIPRRITELGNALAVEDFYAAIYNATPAHSDDVHAAMIESADIEIITPSGRERRSPNTIAIGDVVRRKRQLTLFPMPARSSIFHRG